MIEPDRRRGWYTMLDWYPNPDTLKWFSMFGLIREIAAVTIFAKRGIEVLCGPGSLDDAVQAHAGHGRCPTNDGQGEFTARVEHHNLP